MLGRSIVLIDGEHYPEVVRDTIASLGREVVGAAFLGGAEKIESGALPDYGLPVAGGVDPEAALVAALEEFHPDEVIDLSDEPVVSSRLRFRLAARALLSGASYRGADFLLRPPPRPRVLTKPSVAVIGTGKRVGKTAVAAEAARTFAAAGSHPVIVAMGRGGPQEPEIIPQGRGLDARSLLDLANSGRHAASDYLEDALSTGLTTVGARRCGGGLAGAPFSSNVVEAARLADGLGDLVILEGSGAAIPPVHADATLLVAEAGSARECFHDYLGPYRLLLSDLVILTMCEEPVADGRRLSAVESSIRQISRDCAYLRTIFRPFPLEDVTGCRVLYATTAPESAGSRLRAHLEEHFGATVVATSHRLADRAGLRADLSKARGSYEVLLTELKAAAVDVGARQVLAEGVRVVFCDNQLVALDGKQALEQALSRIATLARERAGNS